MNPKEKYEPSSCRVPGPQFFPGDGGLRPEDEGVIPATPGEKSVDPNTAETSSDSALRPPTQADAEALRGQPLEAVIETNRGTIRVELRTQTSPMTVANFKNLADAGFYDGVTFHRVVPNFMIQGGDPTGSGMGGPGYKWPDERSALRVSHDLPGTLSMANAGPNTNGSQFFITHEPTPFLNGKHAVFGHVIEGQDVVDQIQVGDSMRSVQVVKATADPAKD